MLNLTQVLDPEAFCFSRTQTDAGPRFMMQARRYFGKATTLDPNFAPGWMGFGHAFAAQDERDQVGVGV